LPFLQQDFGASSSESRIWSIRNCRMSIWTLIVSGLRTSATLRAVLRQCSRMEVASCADEGETGVDGDRVLIGVPENCELKIPLPAPCRAGFVPVCGVKKLPARHTTRGTGSMRTSLIKRDLSAISAIKSRTPLGFLRNFSLLSGRSRQRGSRLHTEKYFAWGWWTTMAEVDCSGSS
jgi:hypothetical protein